MRKYSIRKKHSFHLLIDRTMESLQSIAIKSVDQALLRILKFVFISYLSSFAMLSDICNVSIHCNNSTHYLHDN